MRKDLSKNKKTKKLIYIKKRIFKKEVLICCRHPSRWHNLLKSKFQKYFKPNFFYCEQAVKTYGFSKIGKVISEEIQKTKSEICFLNLEFFFGIGIDQISKIDKTKPLVALAFDDITFHELNSIQNYPVDLVLSPDPVAVMKYREKTIPAELFFLENKNENNKKACWKSKETPVFFYGHLSKGIRKSNIEQIRSQSIPIQVHDTDNEELPYAKLIEKIKKSKIVLNFSDCADDGSRFAMIPFQSYKQFKGRVIEAGLAKALCVSEYCPSIEILFPNGEMPMFKNTSEAKQTLQQLLSNDALLEQKAKKFSEIVENKYSEDVQMSALVAKLENIHQRGRPTPSWLPSRYVEILVEERVIRPYATEGWPLRNSVREIFDLLTNMKLFTTGQRGLVIWIVLKAILLKYLTKPTRMIRKMRRHSKKN